MSKAILKVWAFGSDSSNKTYETLQYTDGNTSCNCPGWTRRVAADGSRSCKHTRFVDLGIADRECLEKHTYQQVTVNVTVNVPVPRKVVAPKLGQRKMILDR